MFSYRHFTRLLQMLFGVSDVGGSAGDSVCRGCVLSLVIAMLSLGLWAEKVECIGNASSSRADKEGDIDPDLIRLYLEEFRMELFQMKNQLARMNRNSKLVHTTLKGLHHGHRCSSSSHKLTGRSYRYAFSL